MTDNTENTQSNDELKKQHEQITMDLANQFLVNTDNLMNAVLEKKMHPGVVSEGVFDAAVTIAVNIIMRYPENTRMLRASDFSKILIGEVQKHTKEMAEKKAPIEIVKG